MNYFKLLSSLPDHTKMGMFQNDILAPVWDEKHGAEWKTEDLLAAADRLMAHAATIGGIEWGDIRSRHMDVERAHFLRRVVALRSA